MQLGWDVTILNYLLIRVMDGKTIEYDLLFNMNVLQI